MDGTPGRAQMQRSIRIGEDGIATYERSVTLAGVNGNDARSRVLESKCVAADALLPEHDLPLLPPNCRFVKERDGRLVVVTEHTPCMRTVRWDTKCGFGGMYDGMRARLLASGAHHAFGEPFDAFKARIESQRRFHLAVPYVVMVHEFSAGRFIASYAYYRPAPIARALDELFAPNFPNCHRHERGDLLPCHLCLTSEGRTLPQRSDVSVAEAIAIVTSDFWNGTWNDHWAGWLTEYAVTAPEVASPWEWERTSKQGPLAMCELPWKPADVSVHEVVERSLRTANATGADHAAHVFDCFVRRVQIADPWDGAPAEPAASVIPQSTARMIPLTNGVVLAIGDTVTLAPRSFTECMEGGTFRIIWFTRERDNRRFAKLDGVADPVLLIVRQQLVRGVTIASRTYEAPTMNGVRLDSGAIITITDRTQWPSCSQPCYLIATALRGRDGAVMATFRDDPDRRIGGLCIGTGDVLAPGLRVDPPENVTPNGTLQDTSYTTGDGVTVRVGDTLWVYDSGYRAFTGAVRHIDTLRTGDGARCATLANGTRVIVETLTGNGARQWNPNAVAVRGELPKVVRIGRNRFRIGARVATPHGSGNIIAFSPVLPNGRQYVHVCTIGWLRIATAPAAFDPNVFRYVPIPRYTRRGVLLGREAWHVGDTFVEVRDGIFVRRTITEFAVDAAHAAVTARHDGGETQIITNGARSPAIARVRPLRFRGVTLTPGTELRLRVPCMWLPAGERMTVDYCMEAAAAWPAMIVTTTGLGILCSPNPVTALDARCADGAWVELPIAAIPVGFGGGLQHVYLPADGALRCVQFGTMVVRAADGRPAFRIGDRVRVEESQVGILTDAARAYMREGGVFTIVHAGTDGRTYYLYLDGGRDIGGRQKDYYGIRGLPEHLYHSASWWARIVVVEHTACTRVDALNP